MHHLPDEVRANHLNPGFMTHIRESLFERTLLSATGLVDIGNAGGQLVVAILNDFFKFCKQ